MRIMMGGTRFWCAPALALVAVLASCTPEPAKQAEPMMADAGVVSQIVGVATVSDGSTIRIGQRRIRFDGVATPGQGSVCGDVNVYRAGNEALRQLTRSNQVTCRISDVPDSSGRDIAQCSVGGADIGEYMVANGWAREVPRDSGGAYAEEEAAARAAGLGVWDASCPANLWRGRDF
jgi:endonuclease YncB( thermonuclease family)